MPAVVDDSCLGALKSSARRGQHRWHFLIWREDVVVVVVFVAVGVVVVVVRVVIVISSNSSSS